ncbi:hypothetical protein B0I08_104274 [Glaciihabitans tibetensis]|uniref:DUF4352 domain-containing protein n=1 Tax=Glaciihabitans tibetensis TaxID=1266600 RepID=A0A2T0VEG5_9MICO|nr:hypothetical protein [Glaciihabitans tibetensis]PRY68571.1 hypothetical protein B0I08_104274 [Glaciihabitans tibetensis]
MTEPAPQPRTNAWRARAIRLSDRVPTKWFITGLSILFLIASAAFGGLADAATPALPELKPGDSFAGSELKISVVGAVLIDAFPAQSIEPAEGNRLLVVRAVVENLWDKPVPTLNGVGAADNLRPVDVDGLDADEKPLTVAIVSDGTISPALQPGVPVELAFIWEVSAGALSDEARLRVNIFDKVYSRGGGVAYGERFIDPFVAAYTELAVNDVGAGATAESEQNP